MARAPGPAAVALAMLPALAGCARSPRATAPAARPPAGAAEWTEPRSGLAFLPVPGGRFVFGCLPGDAACRDDEKPARTEVVAPFWLARTETPVEAYARCVDAGACARPEARAYWGPKMTPADDARMTPLCNWGKPDKARHPMNCVYFKEAEQFCRWVGGRLPSAVEWEFAAKGGEDRLFAWGNEPPAPERANYCDRNCRRALPDLPAKDIGAYQDIDDGWAITAPVGSYPAGAGKFGMLDLTGNVAEWVATPYDARYLDIRGGSWCRGAPALLRNSAHWSRVESRCPDAGFRCLLEPSR